MQVDAWRDIRFEAIREDMYFVVPRIPAGKFGYVLPLGMTQ